MECPTASARASYVPASPQLALTSDPPCSSVDTSLPSFIQINQFLATYDIDLICRAHMVVEDGYEFWNERTLVTVFSAPVS